MVECLIMYPLSYFQYTMTGVTARDMCCLVCGMAHMKTPMLLIGKCTGGNVFPPHPNPKTNK